MDGTQERRLIERSQSGIALGSRRFAAVPDPLMSLTDLHRLARLHSVTPGYRDGFREWREPSDESLRAILTELGVDAGPGGDVKGEIRRARQERWNRLLEPVIVCWTDRPAACWIRLTPQERDAGVTVCLSDERGEEIEWRIAAEQLSPRRDAVVEGCRYLACLLLIDALRGIGYFQLRVQAGRRVGTALVIHAPNRAPDLRKTWGVFMPLYAVHSRQSPATGTFSDLARLTDWVRDRGGGLVATLPLLAAYLDEPFAPSPYTPVSRCFWNEFYLELREVPEWRPEFGGIGTPPAGRHVNYRDLMREKRSALERCAAALPDRRRVELADEVAGNPELRAYAAFRASMERGAGGAGPFDLDDPACRYHSYVQWLADAQVAALARRATQGGPGLYLDLPLGVHPQGFDLHRHAGIFAKSIAGGAPPDRFFSKGQNWGFTPLHPRHARERGHDYFIACLRHHMRHAGLLRIDHVMGLHRLYWIPSGFDGDQGAYVQYPANELYAIVCLEAQRHGTAIVGEDLGTVPRFVRSRMAERGFRRSYVSQFEFRTDRDAPMKTPSKDSVASVNTHDTALFAAFWEGEDIESQVELGLLDREHAEQARDRRQELRKALLGHFRDRGILEAGDRSGDAVLRACLAELAASDAECVIVTLEDLWAESLPQNTPGTDRERPNWTRRSSVSLDGLLQHEGVRDALQQVDCRRRGGTEHERIEEPRVSDGLGSSTAI